MRHFALYILLLVCVSASAQQVSPLDKELDYAEYLVKNDRRNLAFSTLNQFIKKHPSNTRAYSLRSENYLKDHNYKSALQDIDFAIKHKPRIAGYHQIRGRILFCSNKYQASAESYVQALELDTLYDSYYFASKSFYFAETFDKASEYMQKFISIYPENDTAKSLYAEILASNGDQIEALRIVNSKELKDAGFYRLRGIIYCKSELYEYALKDLNTALDLKPSLSDVYLWRGLSYYFSGDKENAKSDWNKALTFNLFKANDYLEKYR